MGLFFSAFSSRSAFLLLVLPVLFFWFADAGRLSGQTRIYPTVLYSGVNPLTITANDGISKIEIETGSGWTPVVIGQKNGYYKIMTTPIYSRCAKKAEVRVFVERIDVSFTLRLRVTDCDGSRETFSLQLENTWNLFHEDYGTITIDDRPCHTFMVVSDGGDFIIDRVEIPSKQFVVRYPFAKPPLKITGSKTYRYSVCFTPLRTGRLKVPVYVHIRRGQPSGKYKTYIVADTAYVNVVPSSRPDSRTPPRDPVVIIEPPPKPKPPRLPPGEPATPPHPPHQVFDAEPIEPDSLMSLSERPEPEFEVVDTTLIVPPPLPEYYHDPTTFRTILSPSARSVGKGNGFVASYDIAGLLAGYGLTDRLTVIGGGVFAPLGDNTTGAVTGGGKYEFVSGEMFRTAGGIQANFSASPESEIIAVAPFVTGQYGTVDYGLNVTLGYTWRKHFPSDTTIAPFTRQAPLLGLAGDFRFADHWKIAAEGFLIANSEFQPLGVTLRWFNNRVAIEGGAAVDLTPDGSVTVLPIVSGIWTW